MSKRAINKLFSKNHIRTFGNSMYPLLHDQDVVYFHPISFSNIKVDDIVIARYKELFLTHRVIYKSTNYVVTKGDNNYRSDGHIDKNDIIGKVDYVIRKGKKIDPEHLYLIQSANYFKEIVHLQQLLKKNRIDFVFLKGLPLYLHYQGSIPRRLFADCDLLIKRSELKKILEVIKNEGYVLVDRQYIEKNIHSIKELSLYKKVNEYGIVFDLHVEPVFMMNKMSNDMFYPPTLLEDMTDQFLKKKVDIQIQHQKMSLLDGNQLIMYLCLHFFHHNFKENFRLALIDDIIRNGRYSWKELSDMIVHYRVQHFVYPVFLILRTYYQTSIPHDFIQRIKPKSVIANELSKYVVSDRIFDSQNRLYSGIERFILLLLLGPSPFLHKCKRIINWQIISLGYASILIFIQSLFTKNSKK